MKKSTEGQKKSRKKIVISLLAFSLVILIIALAAGFYFFNEYQNQQKLKNNPQAALEEENKELVAKVGKLIKLPNEKPSVATVSDVSKLTEQTLFKNAQNGDKVLIFDKAKRAIVYRPSENLIIEVGNVVVSAESAVSEITPAEKVSVVLYNGTDTSGYAKQVGDELSAKFSNINVGNAANASSDYEKSLVVDLTGDNKEFSETLAKELNGEVGELPEGEARPANADILIILGN